MKKTNEAVTSVLGGKRSIAMDEYWPPCNIPTNPCCGKHSDLSWLIHAPYETRYTSGRWLLNSNIVAVERDSSAERGIHAVLSCLI